MYWIYLIIFILAVITPDLIRNEFNLFSMSVIEEERMEEILIFLLGTIGFLIFIAKEKQLYLNIRERSKIQKEASIISRDLTDSYSYIGEINRKMEVLKNVALGLTESSVMVPEKEKEIYDYILHAISVFSKSKQISLRFIDTNSKEILKEVKSSKNVRCDINSEEFFLQKTKFFETSRHFFIRSEKTIDGIVACIGIAKRNKQHKIEDPELLKVLASQALFLFTVSKKIK